MREKGKRNVSVIKDLDGNNIIVICIKKEMSNLFQS